MRLVIYWLVAQAILLILYLAPDRWPVFKAIAFLTGCALSPPIICRAYWWEEGERKKRVLILEVLEGDRNGRSDQANKHSLL